MKCKRCLGNNIKLRRVIFANGINHFAFYCIDCVSLVLYNEKMWISHKTVYDWIKTSKLKCSSFEDIPLINKRKDKYRCVVCGSENVEYHHWLPFSLSKLFDICNEDWPGDYLCRDCHRKWHNIVTPYLSGKNWKDKYESI